MKQGGTALSGRPVGWDNQGHPSSQGCCWGNGGTAGSGPCLSSGQNTEPTAAEVSASTSCLAGGEGEKGKTCPWLPSLPVAPSTVPALAQPGPCVSVGSGTAFLGGWRSPTLLSVGCYIGNNWGKWLGTGWHWHAAQCLCHQQTYPDWALLTPLHCISSQHPLPWGDLPCCPPQKGAEYKTESAFSPWFKRFLTIIQQPSIVHPFQHLQGSEWKAFTWQISLLGSSSV